MYVTSYNENKHFILKITWYSNIHKADNLTKYHKVDAKILPSTVITLRVLLYIKYRIGLSLNVAHLLASLSPRCYPKFLAGFNKVTDLYTTGLVHLYWDCKKIESQNLSTLNRNTL